MICWICGENIANSGEHKFKSSILKKMHGKQFTNEIFYGNDKKELKLEGPNSKKVKFPKVICEICNNSVTSDHDKAFDILVNWSNLNYTSLKTNQFIDFEKVYGSNWIDQKRNLLKYIAKHAGCKIVTGKQLNDVTSLSNLIYKNIDTKSFQIKFIVKEGFNYLDLILRQRDVDGLKFVSNSATVYYQNREFEIVYFAGMTTYNWLSIAWVHTQNNFITKYDGFSNQIESLTFLPFDELPEISNNNDWINVINLQRMETLEDQITYYNTFLIKK